MTTHMSWRKSGRSQNGGTCVEVRQDLKALRDTKNPGVTIDGDVSALVRAVREGHVG